MSSLQFRMAGAYPRGFIAGGTGVTLRTWGLRDRGAYHQYIGARPSVQPGLALTFSNVYQHRQSSFALLDPTKLGRQMLVSFFLVDPEVEGAVGTAEVAPQQREWAHRGVDEAVDLWVLGEVVERVVDAVEGIMDVPEVEEYARELRETRERFREANDSCHFCIPFDIWSPPDTSTKY